VAFLIDTSILVRLANRADPAYQVADRAVVELRLPDVLGDLRVPVRRFFE
jgi:hypothetical protein